MKNKILLILDKYKNKFQPQIDAFILRLQPIREYWKHLSEREHRLLALAGGFIVLMILLSIINMAHDFKTSLKDRSIELARYRIEAQILAKQYKNLTLISPNDFSTVNSERIKSDAISILGVKAPEVVLDNDILTVKVNSTQFEDAMMFFDQLRKSYGLFLLKLEIIRLPQSGFVTFNATFKVQD